MRNEINKLIKIIRNNNEIIIKPDFEKQFINLIINGKIIDIDGALNSKNQLLATNGQRIGVQLTAEQAEQTKNWRKEFDEINKKSDEEKIKKIKGLKCEFIEIEFHNYLTQRYISPDNIEYLSDQNYATSRDFKRLSRKLNILNHNDLRKIGIETVDDFTQKIIITDEIREIINSCYEKEEIKREKERKLKKEKTELKEDEGKKRIDDLRKLAEQTNEKQVVSTSSVIMDDGNLSIKTKYILPNGNISSTVYNDTN